MNNEEAKKKGKTIMPMNPPTKMPKGMPKTVGMPKPKKK